MFSGTTTAEIPITNTSASSTRSRLAQCWLIAGPQKEGLSLTRTSKNLLNEHRTHAQMERQRAMEARAAARSKAASEKRGGEK